MLRVLQTTLLAEAEALRLARAGEGIPSHVSGRWLSGVLPNAFAVWIEDDADLQQALRIVDTLRRQAP